MVVANKKEENQYVFNEGILDNNINDSKKGIRIIIDQ